MKRSVLLFVFCGLLAATGVNALGGGVDARDGVCDMSDPNGPGCNPDAGKIGGRCVELQGSGYVKADCSRRRPGSAVVVGADEVVAAGEFGGTGHGPILTMSEVERLWVEHGGDPAEAHTAAAVATAESGRRPAAVNGSNSNGSIDRGLFQMNSIHGGCSTFDLAENVRCAVQLRGSARGWKHWVAYNTGAYRRYL